MRVFARTNASKIAFSLQTAKFDFGHRNQDTLIREC